MRLFWVTIHLHKVLSIKEKLFPISSTRAIAASGSGFMADSTLPYTAEDEFSFFIRSLLLPDFLHIVAGRKHRPKDEKKPLFEDLREALPRVKSQGRLSKSQSGKRLPRAASFTLPSNVTDQMPLRARSLVLGNACQFVHGIPFIAAFALPFLNGDKAFIFDCVTVYFFRAALRACFSFVFYVLPLAFIIIDRVFEIRPCDFNASEKLIGQLVIVSQVLPANGTVITMTSLLLGMFLNKAEAFEQGKKVRLPDPEFHYLAY